MHKQAHHTAGVPAKSFGLIGLHLEHSFSARYFAEKFEREQIENFTYQLFPLKSIADLPQLIQSQPHLVGLNVTIPYKSLVIPHLDALDSMAREVGAVNTIQISRSGNDSFLKGYNTDVIGFSKSLSNWLKTPVDKALVLGSGGASKAVCYALRKLGIQPLVVSRNPDPDQFSYLQVNGEIMQSYRLIINTTPVGMWPEITARPALPYNYLDAHHHLYDLIYNPEHTGFLKSGLAVGARVKNGAEMLRLQAEAAWDIWNI